MNSIPGNASQNPSTSGNKDYMDKGLESAEKKFGGSAGQNTEKNSNVNEKIVSGNEHVTDLEASLLTLWQTDGARNMFEKATGKDVPDKVSN